MKGLLYLNLAVLFLMEMGMLAAMGYWGFKTHIQIAGWLWGIGLPLTAASLWGVWAAPKSSRRLPMPYRAVFAFVLFAFAAVLLYLTGQKTYAIIFLIVATVSMLVSYSTGN